jgi:nuclear GTP-binding protein
VLTHACCVDLVPKEIAVDWLKYFRQELPTVAFKAATKKTGVISHGNLPLSGGGRKTRPPNAADDVLASSECLGADTLLHLLKNYTRNSGVKTAVTVGLVGMPNVGKSSVINSLKRTRAAAVGNTPGVTKAVQEIHLDKQVRLLDSPGVVFSSAEDENAAALRNCVKVCS